MNKERELTLEEIKEGAEQSNDQAMLRAIEQIERGRAVLERSKQRGEARKQRKAGETRGGARPGAGRPVENGEKASKQVAFRLTPTEAATLLKAHGEDGDTIHKVCQRLARAALEDE